MSDTTYIKDLTVGELRELIRSTMAQSPRTRMVRGLQGIADTLQVSMAQAKRIKASGLIDKAITQSGRVILTDADLAVSLYRKGTTSTRSSLQY